MTEITTNDRFDRLTNLDIKTHYGEFSIYAMPSEILAAFAYWVTAQNPNKDLVNIYPALAAFESHVLSFFDNPTIPEAFNQERLQEVVNEKSFESFPAIRALEELEPDFISLGALARNVYYMILREQTTQNSGD